jgi:hypothetical protein
MTAPDPARSAGRAVGALASGRWKAKARQAAATLKSEYEAGKQGDTSPAAPIWSTPKEQLDALIGLLRTSKAAPNVEQDRSAAHDRAPGSPDAATPERAGMTEDVDTAADAAEVTAALRTVDWAGVRAATSERTGEAAKAMKAMADQVDWSRVQPVAAQISTALIAAVASGQVPIGGRLGGTVARAIADQSGLGQRVARNLQSEQATPPPDFRGAIEAVSREA